MAKTIAVIGTIDNPSVQEYICQEVSLFINETICFQDLKIIANAYIEQIEGKINAEQINEYVMNLASTNIDLKYNIGIITNFELLSVANQNKLLKTIEDCTENTIQIIVCKSEQKLINTIKSRVITVDMRTESLEFECLEEERPFYQEIVFNQAELNFLANQAQTKATVYAIYQNCMQNEYLRAYILYTTMFKEYNKLLNTLVLRVLFTSLYRLNKYSKLKELLEYEERLFYNLNERLQIESMFVQIIKEKNE